MSGIVLMTVDSSSLKEALVTVAVMAVCMYIRAAVHLKAVVGDVVGAWILRNGLASSRHGVGESDL